MIRDHTQHRDAQDTAVELRRMDRLLEAARAQERARIVDDLRYGRNGMGDVVGPSIRAVLADIVARGPSS